jgi:hypothetical protein
VHPRGALARCALSRGPHERKLERLASAARANQFLFVLALKHVKTDLVPLARRSGGPER